MKYKIISIVVIGVLINSLLSQEAFSKEKNKYKKTSCKEAKYYLNICGLKRLDRDKDGIPCEKLCK